MVEFVATAAEISASSLTLTVDTVMVIGTAKAFAQHMTWVCEEVFPHLRPVRQGGGDDESPPKRVKLVGDPTIELLNHIVGTLQPSPDVGASTEQWISLSTGDGKTDGPPLKVVLGVLPDKVSRHNSPGQPHGVVALLKKHYRYKETTVICPLCEEQDHVMSVACAVARVVGVSYQRKAGGQSFGIPNDTSAAEQEETVTITKVLFPAFFGLEMPFLKQLTSLAWGIRMTRRLCDTPCNELHTTAFVEEALALAKGLSDVSTSVIQGKDLEDKGFGGL